MLVHILEVNSRGNFAGLGQLRPLTAERSEDPQVLMKADSAGLRSLSMLLVRWLNAELVDGVRRRWLT